MKNIFNILSMVMIFVMIASMCITSYAYTVAESYIIDNDDDDDENMGFYNDNEGFSWFSAARSYNSDARICDIEDSPNSTGNYYMWGYDEYFRSSRVFIELSVYLYNANFTDPSATYFTIDTGNYSEVEIGTINQDLAATGWNVIGTKYTSSSGSHGFSSVFVTPSDNIGESCGADAIDVQLGY